MGRPQPDSGGLTLSLPSPCLRIRSTASTLSGTRPSTVIRVGFCEFVSVHTVRPRGVDRRHALPRKNILPPTNDPQMARIDTSTVLTRARGTIRIPVVANVIDIHPLRNRTVGQLPSHSVGWRYGTGMGQPEPAIACGIHVCQPRPAVVSSTDSHLFPESVCYRTRWDRELRNRLWRTGTSLRPRHLTDRIHHGDHS